MNNQGSPITERHMAALWERMEKIYGKRFTEEYGNAIDFWYRAFQEKGLTGEDLRTGLNACLDSGDQFPPTLPKFLRMCRPMRAAAHVPFEPTPRLSLEHRQQQSQKLGHHLEQLKRALGYAPQDGAAPESLETGEMVADQERLAGRR